MNEQLQTKLAQYIDQIANSLGIASQYVFQTLVRQKIVEGFVYTPLLIALVVIAIIGTRIIIQAVNADIKKKNEARGDNWFDWTDYSHAIVPLVMIWIFVPVLVAINLPDSIMKIFNPQYYALQEILSIFKKV